MEENSRANEAGIWYDEDDVEVVMGVEEDQEKGSVNREFEMKWTLRCVGQVERETEASTPLGLGAAKVTCVLKGEKEAHRIDE